MRDNTEYKMQTQVFDGQSFLKSSNKSHNTSKAINCHPAHKIHAQVGKRKEHQQRILIRDKYKH